VIESRQNAIIKRLKELREARGRRESGLFLIDGQREIERALDKKVVLETAYLCDAFPFETPLLKKILDRGIKLVELGKHAYGAVCYRENPAGLLVEARTWPTDLSRLQVKAPTLVILAEDIEKPGNLGTLLRTCDAVGVDAVIGCNLSIDLFNPNVLRGSAGGAFSVPYATANWNDALNWIKKHKLRLVATSPAATRSLWQADLKGPTAVAIGSEARGLTQEILDSADEKISLPMRGIGDSLNVSVATGAILYEILRQKS
jgi:TrmH family RNA methyltransferase